MSAKTLREQKCPFGCGGMLRVPKGTRSIPLDQVIATHAETCPAKAKSS